MLEMKNVIMKKMNLKNLIKKYLKIYKKFYLKLKIKILKYHIKVKNKQEFKLNQIIIQ